VRSRKRINNAKAEAKQVRKGKANPVKGKVNPVRSRKRINKAKAEAKQVRKGKANLAKARVGVPTIKIIRKQPKAVMASRAARTTSPIDALTATAAPVAAAAAPTYSRTWITLILTVH
jgi:hypothetical protein